MNFENYIFDALEMVMAWDVQDENFEQVLNDQVRRLSGINIDDIWEHPSDDC